MKLQIMIETPPSAEQTGKRTAPMSVEEKVRDALECIESGYESDVEWLMINKLYKALCAEKPTPRTENLIKMIKPVLAKYGYHGVSAED